MAEKQNKNGKENKPCDPILARFNELVSKYGNLPSDSFLNAFARAGMGLENQPQIQNQRLKSISPLPLDISKEDIGEALRNPYQSEGVLAQTSQVLKFTAYPYFKITKTYADIGTYRYYASPKYLDKESARSKEFAKEAVLVDKLCKMFSPEITAHKIAGQAVTFGKVFYYPRYEVDKVHNKVHVAFLQQLPQNWCTIIGYNNISGYTVSFNMMYFLEPGTDFRQFGDLFEPYVSDFNRIFVDPKTKTPKIKTIYASKSSRADGYAKTAKGNMKIFPENVNPNGIGNPKLFLQNGTWMYWVSLPADKIWTFEIDDTTPAVVSPLSGLMLTYAQQSDFENAQLALLLSPLIKIFTGEIPYFAESTSRTEDGWRLGSGGRLLFQTLFQNLMAANNTGGTALFMAPLENIKSHDFPESSNANEISTSFNRYGLEKAGLSGILPTTNDPKAGLAEMSAKLESRFTNPVYRQYERMMECIFEELNLKFSWKFQMFGSIYTEESIKNKAEKALQTGDTSAYFILAALDGESYLDKISMARTINESGLLDLLKPPETSYTMSKSTQPPKEAGRPSKTVQDVAEGKATEATEKTIDARGSAESITK